MIARYSREHEHIINAMGDLRRASADATDEVLRGFALTLAGLLDPHTRIEEVGLFAELRKEEEFAAHVEGLCAEHTTLDGLLARVAQGDRSMVPVLDEALWRHIDKEENGLFPAAIIAVDGEAWTRIVEAIAAVDAIS